MNRMMGFPGAGVYFGDVCFTGTFFGRLVDVKHDAWKGPNGREVSRCVYCNHKVVG